MGFLAVSSSGACASQLMIRVKGRLSCQAGGSMRVILGLSEGSRYVFNFVRTGGSSNNQAESLVVESSRAKGEMAFQFGVGIELCDTIETGVESCNELLNLEATVPGEIKKGFQISVQLICFFKGVRFVKVLQNRGNSRFGRYGIKWEGFSSRFRFSREETNKSRSLISID